MPVPFANPLITRSLHTGSRRVNHLLVRVGYLAGLTLLMLFAMLGVGALSGPLDLNALAKAGSNLFVLIAYGQVIAVCLLAPIFMAGAIASEQSGQTYNILLTTPLSNLQVVLGSLFGRLFFVLALLFSGLPLFAVLLLFGGVPASAVFVAFAIAALTALAVGSVAVTLSVLRAGGRKAVFSFVIGTAGLLIAVYLLDLLVLRDGRTTTFLTPLHPILVLEASVRNANYAPPPPELLADRAGPVAFYLGRPFASFALISTGVSALLMGVCALGVRRIGQGVGGLGAVLPAPLQRLLRLNAERTRAPRAVSGNPIAWKEAHTRGKITAGILGRAAFLLLSAAGIAALLLAHHRGQLPALGTGFSTPAPQPVFTFANQAGTPAPAAAGASPAQQAATFHALLGAGLLLQLILITLIAVYMSAGCVSREREDGTLDILLTTPVTPRQYIWGKLRGLVRFLSVLLAAPVLTLAAASAYSAFTGATYTHAYAAAGGATGSVLAPLVPLWAPVLLAVLLIPFVAFAVAVGIFFSLRCRTVIGAVVATLGVVGAVGGLFSLCGVTTGSSLPVIGPVVASLSPFTATALAISPHRSVAGFAESAQSGAVSLVVAAAIALAVYAVAVQILIMVCTRDFDQTVRRLSGG